MNKEKTTKKQLKPDAFTFAVIAEMTKRGYGERVKYMNYLNAFWGPEGLKLSFEGKVNFMADQMIRLIENPETLSEPDKED